MNDRPHNKKGIKAIVTIITVVLLIGGYYFLKGSKLLVRKHYYYAYFNNVQGLQPSSPVKIKGVRVGKISDIDITGDNVKITIAIGKDIILPQGTIANLASGGISGEKMIDLQPGPGPSMLADGSTIATTLDSTLLPVSVRFTPVFETAKFLLRSTDSTLRGVNSLFRQGFLRKTAIGIVNLEEQMHGMSRMSASLNQKTNLGNSIDNASRQTAEMAASEDELNASINHAVNISGNLVKKTDISADMAKLQTSIKNLGNTFRKLDTATSGFGKLINDKSSYQNTTNSFDTLKQSWEQLQKDPPGISIFGGKKKK